MLHRETKQMNSLGTIHSTLFTSKYDETMIKQWVSGAYLYEQGVPSIPSENIHSTRCSGGYTCRWSSQWKQYRK